MKFNLNDYVKVQLTDRGRAIHRAQHQLIFDGLAHKIEYHPPKEDADGWSTWQLWALMNVFGSECRMGPEPPFKTEIELVRDNLHALPPS